MDWKRYGDERPNNGDKVVLLHTDGSGAELAMMADDGLIDCQEAEPLTDFLTQPDVLWARIPDNHDLWFETTS